MGRAVLAGWGSSPRPPRREELEIQGGEQITWCLGVGDGLVRSLSPQDVQGFISVPVKKGVSGRTTVLCPGLGLSEQGHEMGLSGGGGRHAGFQAWGREVRVEREAGARGDSGASPEPLLARTPSEGHAGQWHDLFSV